MVRCTKKGHAHGQIVLTMIQQPMRSSANIVRQTIKDSQIDGERVMESSAAEQRLSQFMLNPRFLHNRKIRSHNMMPSRLQKLHQRREAALRCENVQNAKESTQNFVPKGSRKTEWAERTQCKQWWHGECADVEAERWQIIDTEEEDFVCPRCTTSSASPSFFLFPPSASSPPHPSTLSLPPPSAASLPPYSAASSSLTPAPSSSSCFDNET